MGENEKHPTAEQPDELAKAKNTSDIELTEQELNKASGGSFSWGATNAVVNEKVGPDH